MEQLIMRWKNDGKKMDLYTLPEGYTVKTLPEVEDGVDAWLDIIQYGLSEGRQNQGFYIEIMVNHDNYNADKCFLLIHGEEAVSTITVICNYEKKE